MNTSQEELQRKEFRDILFELASNQNLLDDKVTRAKMYKRMEKLYHPSTDEKPFRHFYSDIFSVLTTIQKIPEKGDINVLGQNLAMIREKYIPGKNVDSNGVPIDINDSIRKLYDHVSLDIARILYSEEGDRRTSGENVIIDVQTQIQTIKSEVQATADAQNSLSEELGRQQREYLAILSIFAAIVLAFISGIVFSTSVLQNINAISAYRLVAVVLLIGLVLSNTLFGLFYYMNHLVHTEKTISIKPIIIANIVLFLMLIATVIAWKSGFIEARNAMILKN